MATRGAGGARVAPRSRSVHNGRVDEDLAEIKKALDFTLRVGELLLSNGAGAADVAATADTILRHLGLRNAEVEVTFTSIVLSHQVEDNAVFRRRNVTQRDTDYEDLTRADHLVTALLWDRIDLDEARTELNRLVSTGHKTPRWVVTMAMGLMSTGISLLLGGNWIVMIIAFLAGMGVDLLQRWLNRIRLPVIYQQVAGGLLATLIAVGFAATPLPVDPSIVVSASIIMLLAGLGFIGAAQDALTGYYLTAAARLLEVVLATVGIIVGVSGGLRIGAMLGVDVSLVPGAVEWSDLPPMIFGAALCAAAFALSAYAPWRVLAPIGVMAAAGEFVYYVMERQGFGRPWSTAVAAIGIGVVSYGLASRFRVPPLVIVVSGITPFLPGLSIYRSLSLMTIGNPEAIVALATAAAVAIALASGVILGEYIAQPLRREARKFERRLSGPRLVGPLRLRTVRNRKKTATREDFQAIDDSLSEDSQ